MKKEFLFIFLIVLFAGVIRIPSLSQPLGPDQGIMSVIGEGILKGGIPYRDFWEMGSPAIFFTYALMFKVFGISMAAIPLTDMLVSMLTTFLVFLLARLVWDNKTGCISAIVFAFFSNGIRIGMHAGGDVAFGTFWYISQRETFILPLVVASFYLVLRAERGGFGFLYLFFAGSLVGLAFVYKFPAFVFFLCLLLYINRDIVSAVKQNQWGILFKKNITIAAGFVLALIPFVLFFIIKGALQDMVDVIFKFVFSVYGTHISDFLGTLKTGLLRTAFIAKENFILWVFFITSGVYVLVADRKRENLLVVLWAFASLVFIISHREFFGYHFLVIFPPFSLLTGYGLVTTLGPRFSLKSVLSADWGKAFIVLALIANLAFFATLNYMHYTKFYYFTSGKISKSSYYDFFNAYPKHDYSFPADFQVSQYIVDRTHQDDMVFVLGGIESVLHFLTKRKCPSRFVFSWILFSDSHGKAAQAGIYRQELLEDLESKLPKFIVTIHPLNDYKRFSKIYDFIYTNYRLEQVFPDERFLYVLDTSP